MSLSKLHISKISISNFLGIKQLTFDADGFNEITGENGEAKTTIIEAIKSVFQGGNDATLIRKGSSHGEVGIVLSDGTNIYKTFGDESDLIVTDSAGGKIKKPAGYLKQLADIISVNPAAFLTADNKKKTDILLNTLDLKIDKKDLEGIEPQYYQDINLGFIHALEAISKIHKAIFDERTGTNRLIKDKDSTIKELQEGLSDMEFDPSKDYEAQISALEDLKSKMEAKMRGYVEEFDAQRSAFLEKSMNTWNSEKQLIENEYQIELAKIQSIRNSKIIDANSNYDSERLTFLENDTKLRAERQEAYNQKFNPLLEQIATFKEKQKHFAGYQKQNELINRSVAQREEEILKATSLNEQLAILSNLKLSLLEGLPIDGLEVIDGQIYRHGIIFDRLNTAQQVEIAIEIAKLRAGDLGLVCIDNLELFGPKMLSAFIEKAKSSDLQYFMTRVGAGDLSINGKVVNTGV